MLGVEGFTGNFTSKFWWQTLQLKHPDRRRKTQQQQKKQPNQTAYQQLNIIDSCMHLLSPSCLLLPTTTSLHPTDSVLPTPFPLLIIPQQKDGAHQTHRGKSWPWHRLIVAPASGNPDRAPALAGTREAASLEIFPPKEWRGWSLSKREVLILLPSLEACFSLSLSLPLYKYIYIWRAPFPITPHFQHQISRFSGAKLTRTPLFTAPERRCLFFFVTAV